MRRITGILSLLVLAGTVISVGCADPDCIEYCEYGCPTMDQVLDEYSTLVNCCSGLNIPEDRPEWVERWQNVPVPLLDWCVNSIECTDGPLTCEDRNAPLTWGDQENMDACMRAIVDAGSVFCSNNKTLKIVEDRIGCVMVDCNAFCVGRPGGCFTNQGRADCGCGFLLPD